jgi:hypothetical protein
VLEVATICVQKGSNPARHIHPFCFPISVNNKHSLLQSILTHFPTILRELTHYTNTHEQQPYCVRTLDQMTERSAEARVRQKTGWLAGGPLLHVATIRHTTDTFLFISHITNILLFRFCCNIFSFVRIIKEMLGSVASGTPCTIAFYMHCVPGSCNQKNDTLNQISAASKLPHTVTFLMYTLEVHGSNVGCGTSYPK